MSDLLCKINISDIDQTDERYKISFSDDDIRFLARSIKETGLIIPPLVRALNNTGKFIIVSGFNRVRAQVFNGEKQILVHKMKSGAGDRECLIASIVCLAFKRELSHAELIRSCHRLIQFLNKEEMAQTSSAIFNRELNVRFIEDLLTIGDLPAPALDLIHSGNLAFKSAQRISFFSKETILVFLEIFSRVKASSSKQLEIILHTREILARDGLKPEDVLKNQNIQEILLDENKDPGVKADLLRTFLFELRFPTVSQTRQRVKEKITSLKLGKNIRFLPPENFESQDYTISFTSKNYDEVQKNVKNLVSALDNKMLKQILKQ